jgi:release factor glutamine methyltransferase
VKLRALHRWASERLAQAGIADAALDARVLVEHISGTSRADVIAWPDREIGGDVEADVERALARRVAGEPVHRILGFREFYGLKLSLSPETLEPRPDTETLVEALLPYVNAAAERNGECRILDLGTGTGAIALALLSAVPAARALGVDISDDALATARRNAVAHGLSARFGAVKSDWFSEISGRFDVIAANPPYIPSDEIGALQVEVRGFDPLAALDGGADGLDAYREIAGGAKAHLDELGIVAVEIGSTQRQDVTAIFEANGFCLMQARSDLANNDRVLVFAAEDRP